jgi:PAP2 superfamily
MTTSCSNIQRTTASRVRLHPQWVDRVGLFRRQPWTFEVALFALVLVAYQGSRIVVRGGSGDAFRNALDVIHWEKASGLFFESGVQGFFLNHIALTEVLNHFYIWAHLPLTALFFIWLYRSRRPVYPVVRNAFFIANGIALIFFIVFPVAPPRLLSADGFVDTLQKVSGIDLHGGRLSGWFNPFAAVPSMHFGYAILIGVVGALLVRNVVARGMFLIYPGVVFIVIVGTANHYVLDALAGAAVVALAMLSALIIESRRRRPRIAAPPPAPPAQAQAPPARVEA